MALIKPVGFGGNSLCSFLWNYITKSFPSPALQCLLLNIAFIQGLNRNKKGWYYILLSSFQESGEPTASTFQFEHIFKLLLLLQYLNAWKAFFFSRLYSRQYFTLLQFLSTKAFSSLGKNSLFTNSVENLCIMNRFGLINMQGMHISTLHVSQHGFRRWMWSLSPFCSSALSKATEAVQILLETFPKGQFVTFKTWEASHPLGTVPSILVKTRGMVVMLWCLRSRASQCPAPGSFRKGGQPNLFNRRSQFLSKAYWDYTCNPMTS